MDNGGNVYFGGNVNAYNASDIKFKENIRDIPNAVEKVQAIGGKLYTWSDEYIKEQGGENDYYTHKDDFGVIAQDVQSVFPIATRMRSNGSLAVDYLKLCALAFAAIKELSEELDAIKKSMGSSHDKE
jgi:hypothetical protein